VNPGSSTPTPFLVGCSCFRGRTGSLRLGVCGRQARATRGGMSCPARFESHRASSVDHYGAVGSVHAAVAR
jgi:hypothetical protein